MKLLFIVHVFFPNIGGSSRIYYEICKRLSPDEVYVLTQKRPAGCKEETMGWKEFDAKQKFKIYRIGRLRSRITGSGKAPNMLVSLCRFVFYDLPIGIYVMLTASYIIVKERIEVVCLENPDYLGWVSLLVKYVFGRKTVFYLFGEELTASSGSRFFERPRFFYLSRADGLIAISEFTKSVLDARGLGHKTTLIYPGIDANPLADEAVKENIISKYGLAGKKILLSIGRFERHKGIDNVIRALSLVKEKIPNIVYLIGGEGPEEANLRKLTEDLKMGDIVKFLGQVSGEEMASCYGLCDIFILANKQLKDGTVDGFGMVFIEAGSMGKPVIGGRAGGVPEAIIDKETGILVDGEDVNDIERAVLRLFGDPEFAGMLGDNGKKRAAEFGWNEVVEKFKKVCRAL